MFKMILKNLWARRWRNGWLFAELIIVAVVAWNVIDPIIVDSWVFSQPMGFETNRVWLKLERLYIFFFYTYSPSLFTP